MYKVGDKVFFYFIQNRECVIKEGIVHIVDQYGTFENPGIKSYDIMCDNILYKHVIQVSTTKEDLIRFLIKDIDLHLSKISTHKYFLDAQYELICELLISKYPFLKYDSNNEWCDGNCSDEGWIYNLEKGWLYTFINMLKELEPYIDDQFQINQLKEKFGSLRFYYNCNPKYLNSIREIVSKYEKITEHICIKCGSKAQYVTIGYILPYCKYCVKKEWKVNEII